MRIMHVLLQLLLGVWDTKMGALFQIPKQIAAYLS